MGSHRDLIPLAFPAHQIPRYTTNPGMSIPAALQIYPGKIIDDRMITRVMQDMIRYFDGDVRRINHALKVYSFADIITTASGVDGQKKLLIGLAAILHDIGIKEAERKFNSSSGKHQEREGPPVAREILAPYGLEAEFVDRICYLIGNHHTYSAIDDIDLQILVEADFLVNIYEDTMSWEAIEKIQKSIFKTETGTQLLMQLCSPRDF